MALTPIGHSLLQGCWRPTSPPSSENGIEGVLAERGPGQLVGERGALQVSVRSASVIALETVQALVVRTADFAAFISAHPAVLDAVERQLYDRLTELPA
jgi:CRP-like cAMP-binding protein